MNVSSSFFSILLFRLVSSHRHFECHFINDSIFFHWKVNKKLESLQFNHRLESIYSVIAMRTRMESHVCVCCSTHHGFMRCAPTFSECIQIKNAFAINLIVLISLQLQMSTKKQVEANGCTCYQAHLFHFTHKKNHSTHSLDMIVFCVISRCSLLFLLRSLVGFFMSFFFIIRL